MSTFSTSVPFRGRTERSFESCCVPGTEEERVTQVNNAGPLLSTDCPCGREEGGASGRPGEIRTTLTQLVMRERLLSRDEAIL